VTIGDTRHTYLLPMHQPVRQCAASASCGVPEPLSHDRGRKPRAAPIDPQFLRACPTRCMDVHDVVAFVAPGLRCLARGQPGRAEGRPADADRPRPASSACPARRLRRPPVRALGVDSLGGSSDCPDPARSRNEVAAGTTAAPRPRRMPGCAEGRSAMLTGPGPHERVPCPPLTSSTGSRVGGGLTRREFLLSRPAPFPQPGSAGLAYAGDASSRDATGSHALEAAAAQRKAVLELPRRCLLSG
jgi:hypothetical protein